ncbi:MAG: MarR family transcriptional regulator [Coleofasciculus sp. G1-WW12-02]|uniref:MarR family transcriptional regulator n=1 Tax=unclassified Coleofasciculus TaxID=2692782 RepID=UPI0032F55758
MTHSLVHSIWQKFQSWFTQAQAAVAIEDEEVELPDGIQTQLEQKIQALPCCQVYQTTVQEAITDGVENWQRHLDAANSLIILGSPVEPIAKILSDSLQTWHNPPVEVFTPLPYRMRPHDPLIMSQQIQQALQAYPQIDVKNPKDTDGLLEADSLDDRKTLVMIPCLEQCFLRCIGGWNSIEYLRDMIIHNRNCFWVIGCNHWAWDFLDFVCQISAYFSEVKPLPELDGAMIQTWLNPIAKTIVEPEAIEDSEDNLGQAYWRTLASQSSGVSSIAVGVWLNSLRIERDQLEDGNLSQLNLSETATTNKTRFTLRQTTPTLPSLPSLTGIDRYLLHSLLIHGQMSHTHLALSLGEAESQIQAQIQGLLRAGVLASSNGMLSVRAAHYAKLKIELTNNNFFVGED